MSFLLRAALVIAGLSWLALQRQGTTIIPPDARPTLAEAAAKGWDTLPAPAREAALRAGGLEIARRAASAPASEDTLAEDDRTPAWRGTPPRAEPAGRSPGHGEPGPGARPRS